MSITLPIPGVHADVPRPRPRRPRLHHRSVGQDRHGNRSYLVPPGDPCPVCDDTHPACCAHLVNKRRLPSGEISTRKDACICTYTGETIINETDGPCPYHDEGQPVPCREYRPSYIVPGTVPPRCKIHAGNPLRGPAHPAYKHGRLAAPRYLPSRYIDTVDRLRDDPEFGTLVPHILVCEARIEELLRRLDTDSVGIGVLPIIRSALADLRFSLTNGTATTVDEAISRLEESTRDTDVQDNATWKEILRVQGAMRNLVDAETKRKIVVGEYVHRSDVRELAKEIIAMAAEYIPDEASRGEFIDKIMSRAARANMAASAHITEHYPPPERPALPPGLDVRDGGSVDTRNGHREMAMDGDGGGDGDEDDDDTADYDETDYDSYCGEQEGA